MMFKTDRRVRVARAISDEMFYQRYGFLPVVDTDDVPKAGLLAVAQVAILAADGDMAEIDRMRISRNKLLADIGAFDDHTASIVAQG